MPTKKSPSPDKGRLAKAPDQRKRRSDTRPKQEPAGELPSREDILAFVADNPDLTGKRELARAFGIRGDTRLPFKQLLRDMEADGQLTRSKRTFRATEELPSVTVIDIPGSADPERLIGHPAKWSEDQGPRPDVLIEAPRDDRIVPGPGDRVLARIRIEDGAEPRHRARAMKILDKPRRSLLGIARLRGTKAELVPIDRKGKGDPLDLDVTEEVKDGDLVEIEMTYTGRAMRPRARVKSIIGNPSSEGAISLIALHNLEIPYRFPDGVLRAADDAEEATLTGREDWRDVPFVTIDPADAKDHDDAVFAEPVEENGQKGFAVFVAIADVAAYVRPGTALDREAFLRGNSVYFPDRVVPMLPERISNDLCSLKEGVNRPALAVRMLVDQSGTAISHSFHRVMIRSAARLSYEQAQAAMDGKPDDKTGPLSDILTNLWDAYAALRAARDKRGPLDLDLPERRVRLDENGQVADVYVPPRLDAHRLIEEMMIRANVAAAETLEKHKTPLLYRVHDTPSQQKIAGLREVLKSINVKLAGGVLTPAQFNRILARAESSTNPQLISEVILRAQAQAEYHPDNYGHFGLNLARYAHFTSPIRRYADLIVHRALVTALKLGDDGLRDEDASRLPGIGQHISMTERRAMAAERETLDRLMAHYLADRVGAKFNGRISGVTRSGLFVRLDETGADGFVPASSLGNDYYRFDEDRMAMVGDRTGETFRMGDAAEVRLLEAAPMAGALRFELLSEGQPGKPARGGKSRPPPRRGRKGGRR